MLLSEFKSAVRLEVPGANLNAVTDDQLESIINRGVNDVNSYALAYRGDVKFNVTADKETYDIVTDIATDFLLPDDSGIYWNNGTEWKQLDPKTRKYFDEYVPNWRDASSGTPQFYFTDGLKVTFNPPPDTTLALGFWLYYIKAAQPMTDDAHYPFTGAGVEITYLRDLDDAIIDYVRWKLARPLGKNALGTISKEDYMLNRKEKSRNLERRIDIQKSRFTRMRPPRLRGGR